MTAHRTWTYRKTNKDTAASLVEALQVSPVTAALLSLRGIKTPPEAQKFLAPSLADLVDPFRLTGMKEAVERIQRALKAGEKILVYGDYDADGITAAALLYSCLQDMGGQVSFYIPSRFDEGYGLHREALLKAAAGGTRLLITVDCGEKAEAEIREAAEQGLDIIVTDHHQPQGERAALAHINPLREEAGFPLKNLAGVGVAFKLAQALHRAAGRGDAGWHKYLDLAALGTVADIVPLLGENRILVKYGLKVLNEKGRPGLDALIRAAGLEGKTVDAGQIAFILAPRLNAAGRMGEARPGVELLTTPDGAKAARIAGELNELNRLRQQVEQDIYEEACRWAAGEGPGGPAGEAAAEVSPEAVPDMAPEAAAEAGVLVLGKEGWHQGVLGIVASRLCELFYKPVILLSLDGQGKATGSGRSIPGFNLVEALEEASSLLERFGGHELAAGLTLQEDKVPLLRERLKALARERLKEGDREKKVLLDWRVEGEEVTLPLAEELSLLAPFGYGNPQPLLGGGFKVVEKRRVGKNGNHLKLLVEDRHRTRFPALFFRNGSQGDAPLRSRQVELAFYPEASLWRGRKELSLMVRQWSFDDVLTRGPLSLVDHRGKKKKPYLEELLNYSPGNIMIYVNTRQEEKALAPLAKEGKALLLHQGRGSLPREGDREGHLVFWSLPLREEELLSLLPGLWQLKRLHVHLLYGEADYRQNQLLLKASLPGKEIFTELWAALKESRVSPFPQAGKLKRHLEARLDFSVTRYSVERALAILEEARGAEAGGGEAAGEAAPAKASGTAGTAAAEGVEGVEGEAFPFGLPRDPSDLAEYLRERSSLYREDSAALEKSTAFQEFLLLAAKEELGTYFLKGRGGKG